ncbi:MAG TPA: helix-turn-helix domain-containing protein [Phenylobacterium sp.]
MTTASPEIPRFFLYGEPPQHVGERFVHLESLDERSRPADWHIRPHTHANLNHVFYVAEGGGEMRADGETFAYRAPCLLLVPAGVVHGFDWASETRGRVLTVSRDYFTELASRGRELASVFARPTALPVPEGKLLPDAFVRLAEELAWTAPGHAVAVEGLLLTILVEALRLSHYGAPDAPRVIGPHAALVARFRELVEGHYRSDMKVEDYAGALGAHPKRLRAACLSVAGTTPLGMLQDRRLIEAKRLLLYSNMTVAEAGYYLGFQDPAYFTRFFTKACRTSPRRFRQSPGAIS